MSGLLIVRRHEVSILIVTGVGVGRYLGSQPRSRVSMMIMRPPQQGHGRGKICCSSVAVALSVSGSLRGRRCGEQLAGAFDVGRAVGIGEQAVVADAVQAFRQDMHEEPADELVGGERHQFVAAGPSIR